MPDIPDEMKTKGRPPAPFDDPSEYLYRRVAPDLWDESGIDVDAIELPDMSVNRARFGPPGWTRLADERCWDWAVVGFKVQDIPQELLHLGVDDYTFAPEHAPLKNNYPHSEVRCYRNGFHINAKKHLDRELHLRWREKLLWKIRTFFRPGEGVES
jgi:hypothetical protein